MASEFRMPSLGADMDEGTLVQWIVRPGDAVKRGDVVAVVETDKGAIDVEIFEDGVVRELLVQPGTKVPVGTVLALLEGAGRRPLRRLRRRPVGGPRCTCQFAAQDLPGSPQVAPRELGIDVATLTGQRTRRRDHARGRGARPLRPTAHSAAVRRRRR